MILAVLLVMSIPAFAQHPEGRGEEHAGGGQNRGPNRGFTPPRGPTPVQGPRHEAPQTRDYRDEEGHPNAPPVHPDGANGSDMIPAVETPATIRIVFGSMDTFPGALAAATLTGWEAAAVTVSGLGDTISVSHPMTTAIATTGYGIRTRS